MADEKRGYLRKQRLVSSKINQVKDNLFNTSFKPKLWSDLKRKWQKK